MSYIGHRYTTPYTKLLSFPTNFPSEQFLIHKIGTNPPPISGISWFLFTVFSVWDIQTPWTQPPTPKPTKLNENTVALKKSRRPPVRTNHASQIQVNLRES
jgi:hypothetical protein